MLYPSDETFIVNKCDEILSRAMAAYCFLDIDYRLVDRDSAMIIIDPCREDMWPMNSLLGLTFGTIHMNPLLYSPAKINLSCNLEFEDAINVLTHEIFHTLCIQNYHNIDPESLMADEYNKGTKFTRQDTLYLYDIFKYTKYAKLR